MENIDLAPGMARAALLAIAGCGGENSASSSASGSAGGKSSTGSGCYVDDIPELGAKMELDFGKDGAASMTFIENENRLPSMDCTYQSGEATIALSCTGSSGITLTRLAGGETLPPLVNEAGAPPSSAIRSEHAGAEGAA